MLESSLYWSGMIHVAQYSSIHWTAYIKQCCMKLISVNAILNILPSSFFKLAFLTKEHKKWNYKWECYLQRFIPLVIIQGIYWSFLLLISHWMILVSVKVDADISFSCSWYFTFLLYWALNSFIVSCIWESDTCFGSLMIIWTSVPVTADGPLKYRTANGASVIRLW